MRLKKILHTLVGLAALNIAVCCHADVGDMITVKLKNNTKEPMVMELDRDLSTYKGYLLPREPNPVDPGKGFVDAAGLGIGRGSVQKFIINVHKPNDMAIACSFGVSVLVTGDGNQWRIQSVDPESSGTNYACTPVSIIRENHGDSFNVGWTFAIYKLDDKKAG